MYFRTKQTVRFMNSVGVTYISLDFLFFDHLVQVLKRTKETIWPTACLLQWVRELEWLILELSFLGLARHSPFPFFLIPASATCLTSLLLLLSLSLLLFSFPKIETWSLDAKSLILVKTTDNISGFSTLL